MGAGTEKKSVEATKVARASKRPAKKPTKKAAAKGKGRKRG